MESKRNIVTTLETITLGLMGILLFAFPLFISTLTTDSFILPKQILLGAVALSSLLLLGARSLVEGKVKLRATPFDLPVLLFGVVVFLSAVFSVNRADSLIAYVPLLFAIFAYFAIVNTAKKRSGILFLLGALVAGASIAGLVSIMSFFKVYLPFPYAKVQTFNVFGALLDQAIYLASVLPIAGYIALPLVAPKQAQKNAFTGEYTLQVSEKSGPNPVSMGFAAGFVILTVGLITTLIMLTTSNKPLILPLETGFQTAFSAISRDSGRVAKSFFLGSGFGTYLSDFTRFKEPSYNLNQTLWSFSFFRSSTFVLELLATTGLLGVLSFFFLLFRIIKERSFFLPIFLLGLASFILPFSFTTQALFFIMLGLFTALRAYQNPRLYPDVEFHFVALKQGLFLARADDEAHHGRERHNRFAQILPALYFLGVVGIVGTLGYMGAWYALANLSFQKSFMAIRDNKGFEAYRLQGNAIRMFPYEDEYHTRFSQLNLALANALAGSQDKNASPSAAVQQDILTLVQQSISSGRNAVNISPQTASNWNNLSSIYRSLIGFGQNADRFAVLSNQQAITLDPSNPQQYINLGGIFFQLKLWDEAARQFQVAVQLKRDYANAYYNLGHALEAKGDMQNALIAYQAARNLVAQSKESTEKITTEIAALQEKLGDKTPVATISAEERLGPNDPQPLGLPTPPAQLPTQTQRVRIPGPSVSVSPTSVVSPTASPSAR